MSLEYHLLNGDKYLSWGKRTSNRRHNFVRIFLSVELFMLKHFAS
jgi:hypothetical protein